MPKQSPARSLVPRTRGDLATWAVNLGFGGWLLVTALSQHPHRTFDRLRPFDRVGLLIPNWRFFAPNPARHDFHLLYRTLTVSGEQSPWKSANAITPRNWAQFLWFPGRREEKAVFDICSEITKHMGNKEIKIGDLPCYQLFRSFITRFIREQDPVWPELKGFQFLVTQYSGHDHSEDPKYAFVSPFIPVRNDTAKPDRPGHPLESVA